MGSSTRISAIEMNTFHCSCLQIGHYVKIASIFLVVKGESIDTVLLGFRQIIFSFAGEVPANNFLYARMVLYITY